MQTLATTTLLAVVTRTSVPSLAVATLSFSIIRLVLLVGWVYACLYCVQKIQINPTLHGGTKVAVSLLSFVLGPFVLVSLFIRDIRKRATEESRSFMDTMREHFYNLAESLRSLGRSEEHSIKLLDTSGRSIRELYSHAGREHSQDRHTLDLTQQIIVDAIDQDASDILIDPKDNAVHTVRFRVDGVLREVEQIDSPTCQSVINSIKAVSNMDIADKRRPQDGAFVAKTAESSISFRVASAGVLNGEKLSIRVLNQDAGRFQLDNIGLSEKQQQSLKNAIASPSGMILICGPTGSGKTTTMYAMLNQIDLFTRNVITVEDPIEYVLPQASQIEVNPKADITFAKSLRSMLRQDPDVICVGEIRDEETAQIALRAAQTGHLVFATVHSNSSASAMIRLIDLGVTSPMLSTGLQMIIAQRLLRKLCAACKTHAQLNPRQVNEFRRRQIDPTGMYQAVGCDQCHYTGYRGRIGIYDLVTMDDKIRQNILNNEVALAQLRKDGEKRGKSSLRKQAWKKIVDGTTSLHEMVRVLGVED
jgi:type II secretory ATPase GspE/PulE/Tfp pilus assembly ATPase PilB-like protein